jgi:hypothetical protein
MCADDPSDIARRETTSPRDITNHRSIDVEDEPLREDETLLRAEPRGDDLARGQPPASDWHTGCDSDSEHDNNEPSTQRAQRIHGVSCRRINHKG